MMAICGMPPLVMAAGVAHRFSKVIVADKLENFYRTNVDESYSNLDMLCDWDEVVAEIQPIIENLCDALGDNTVITKQNILCT